MHAWSCVEVKGSKGKKVIFIFAPHSEIIRMLKKEKSRGVIIHEGALVPVFDEKYLEKDNFARALQVSIA